MLCAAALVVTWPYPKNCRFWLTTSHHDHHLGVCVCVSVCVHYSRVRHHPLLGHAPLLLWSQVFTANRRLAVTYTAIFSRLITISRNIHMVIMKTTISLPLGRYLGWRFLLFLLLFKVCWFGCLFCTALTCCWRCCGFIHFMAKGIYAMAKKAEFGWFKSEMEKGKWGKIPKFKKLTWTYVSPWRFVTNAKVNKDSLAWRLTRVGFCGLIHNQLMEIRREILVQENFIELFKVFMEISFV